MNEHLAWYVARASGMVALALLAASVAWGLLFGTRLLQGRPSPKWLLDLHRFLGGLSVSFTAVHVAALVADDYVSFGPTDILVPFASAWRPGPVELFRFSAATFNSHRIHYDLDYARDVEGYPGLVVHGPLTAARLFALAAAERQPRRFAFRAQAPLFAGQPITLRQSGPGTFEAVRCDNVVAMTATADH